MNVRKQKLYQVDRWLAEGKVSMSEAFNRYQQIHDGNDPQTGIRIYKNRSDIKFASEHEKQMLTLEATILLAKDGKGRHITPDTEDLMSKGKRISFTTKEYYDCSTSQYWGNIVQDDDGEP